MTDVYTVLSFDFETGGLGHAQHRQQINTTGSGYAHFVCTWFELQLLSGHNIFLSTNPEDNLANRMRQKHWGQSCTPVAFTADKRTDRRTDRRKQQGTRDDFIHLVDSLSTTPNTHTKSRALLVCEGDTLELTALLDVDELRPEPKVNISWPWTSGTRDGC